MLKKINKKFVLQYIIIFFFFLCWNLFINVIQNDEIWNYGFAHNIYSGLIPYKDFNMVVTPFYPFLMSLPFHIFGSSLLLFHIENALMLTCFTYLVYQLINKKIFVVYLMILFVSDSLTFPSYNLFLLFMAVLIIYLEKKKGNDYVIGLLIALSFLTKQSIGFFFVFPSLYYLKKDKKKLIKRMIGFIIPCLVFLLYLTWNHCVYQFFDLCLFGLFDFNAKNSASFCYEYILFVIYLALSIFFIKKKPKEIGNYYLLSFATMMIPLFDFHHCVVAYTLLLIQGFMLFPFKTKINEALVFFPSAIGIAAIMFFTYNQGYNIVYPNKVPHFEYRFIREDSLKFTNEVLDYIHDHPENKYSFVVSGAYYFRLATNTKMSYLDLINYGNFGYHGSEKIIKKIKENKDSVFVISEDDLRDACQADKSAVSYIIKHGKKIHTIQIYDFYVLE